MMRHPASRIQALVFATVLLLSGCSRREAPRGVTPRGEAPREQAADHEESSPTSFVNRVWRVESSSTVAPGTIYVFLADSTLLITSSNSKPLLGTWKYANGELTMVEEGIPYRVEVLHLSPDQFKIRSHNPGEPVEITLVPAEA
jgi:hypothetical protein